MIATAATWYLRAHDDDRPLGVYIRDDTPLEPAPGIIIESDDSNHTWRRAEVVSVESLPHACSMPRYAVTVRVLVAA